MSNQPFPASNRGVSATDNRTRTTGDEKIDYAGIETERLREEYCGIEATFDRLETEEAAISEVPDDETGDQVALALGGIVKRSRDLRHEAEQTRLVEVEPNFRRYQAGNAYFNGIKERIQPEDRNLRRTKPGVWDRAQLKIDAHLDRKEARERARLEKIKQETERVAREAREAQEKADRERRETERKAQEAQDAIARARSEETRAARQAEADAAKKVADDAAAAAKAAEVVVEKTTEAHQDAHVGTLTSSADVVRTRGTTPEGGGVLLTKGVDKIAKLLDRSELTDEAKLLLFEQATDAQVEGLVSKYANATGHRNPLPGCLITIRKKNVTR